MSTYHGKLNIIFQSADTFFPMRPMLSPHSPPRRPWSIVSEAHGLCSSDAIMAHSLWYDKYQTTNTISTCTSRQTHVYMNGHPVSVLRLCCYRSTTRLHSCTTLLHKHVLELSSVHYKYSQCTLHSRRALHFLPLRSFLKLPSAVKYRYTQKSFSSLSRHAE